jgi:serine/threonine-protein kinase
MDQKADQKVVQKIGKYEIVSELGQGGMGVVYKARDPFIGRLVALKTITPELVTDPEILKRFYREAQSAGTLMHQNIVTIYDLGEADGRPYIAMEFVEGESLQSIINRRARIPLAAKLKLVQQFCEGLGHAHKHGFVHRDVKPANILVTNDGIVKVVDFGIVHLESTNLTKTGMFLGTIHYASPEQINDGRVDSRSDLWSVTCVMYEFIAYKKSFDGSNIAAIIAKVLSSDPEPLSRCCPGVPVELDGVVSRGLKKNIEERYQSLDEMLGDLLPIARSLQQGFIGDLLQEAKDLRDKGDYNGAQEKVRAVLILDNTHGEAKRLHSEIAADVQRQAPVTKAKRLVVEAEQAFSRGEYAEAVRILGEAQELNPADTQARNLKVKALREQDRVKELRDALSSGQRAMKQGDLTGAEQELHRVLQLDQNNPQAAELLEQIRQDRLSRERDFRLKEALWQTDNLVSEGKYEEAQSRLLELQQDFPSSDEVQLKLQALDPLIQSGTLVQAGEHAFNQGEYAEAVRALTEALELNPQNDQARDLRDRALQERDRLRQVREALSSGQRAMRQGDTTAAEREFERALELDPTNTQASSLLGQVRQAQAAREREGRFREALQQTDNLVAEGKLDDAQRALLELQQEYPDSTEIDQKLLALDQQMKLGRLMVGGQQAFDQGEFGEAVRILTEAQELAPNDERVRELKGRAVQQRDLLRQIREAISAGQKAMRQGDAGAAEREYRRALQLDPNNSQATKLLAEVQKERQAREREQRLNEGLSQAEHLISGRKFDEAQRKLTDLQQAYPDADEVQQKLQALIQRKAEAAAPPPPPAHAAPPEKAPARGAPGSEAARSMQSAEELRRRLETPRPSEAAGPTKPPAPAPTVTIPEPPLQATQMTEAPKAEPAAGAFGATAMLPRTSLKSQAQGEQGVMEAPPASPGSPPLPPLPHPQVQAPPPTPAPPRVEPKKPAPAPAPARVTPAPAAIAKKEEPKKSPMLMVVGIAVAVVILAGGGWLYTHRTKPPEKEVPPVEVMQNNQPSETDLFNQAKVAEESKNWGEAISKYTKVAELNGTKKAEAEQHIQQIQENNKAELAKNEKETFQKASRALQKEDYSQAKELFNTVVAMKVPDSKLAPQAQDQLAKIEPLIQAKTEFETAERAANRNDLDGAIAQFDKIANGGGPFASRAKTRASELQKLKTEATANAAVKQEFDAAVTAENNNDLNGALEKFKAIVPKGGTFGSEATKHIQEINDKLAAANAERDWKDALAAENSDPNNALAKFKAIAGKPGPYKDQATAHIQAINDKLTAAADQAKFDDAVKKQNSGDLQGAAAEFKSLVARRPDALDRYGQVMQLIAEANKPKPEPPKPNPGQTGPGPQNPPPTTAVRTPVVLLLPSGQYQAWTRPIPKGGIVPDSSVEGGVKPVPSMSPVAGAPAGAFVVLKINIDPNGNVTPDRVLTDPNGLSPQVMEAAKGWKFNPPTIKGGKSVSTSISVRVTF